MHSVTMNSELVKTKGYEGAFIMFEIPQNNFHVTNSTLEVILLMKATILQLEGVTTYSTVHYCKMLQLKVQYSTV